MNKEEALEFAAKIYCMVNKFQEAIYETLEGSEKAMGMNALLTALDYELRKRYQKDSEHGQHCLDMCVNFLTKSLKKPPPRMMSYEEYKAEKEKANEQT